MWNNLYIKPPPTNSYLGKANSVDTLSLSTSLQNLTDEIEKCKRNLHIEAAILSRLIYRLKIKFRKDKGMKAMLKIKSSLYKYLKLNIVDDIKKFIKSIPSSTKKNIYYPTKQMLEFVMVRIQSFSKLMVRIVNISMELCQFCINRMKLGHFWNIAVLTLALSSRIGELCQHMIEASCVCYDNLYPIRNQLESYGAKWLEPDYKFPEILQAWLDLTWTPEDLKLIAERRLEMPIMIMDEDEDDDVQFCYEYKNDYIVIDDTIKIAENDVQFVQEYIDLIRKMNPRMKIQNEDKNVIEVGDSPNTSDIEIVEKEKLLKDSSASMCDDDVGEKIERDKNDIITDVSVMICDNDVINLDTILTNDLGSTVLNVSDVNDSDMSNTINNTAINLDTPSTIFSSPENKKRKKRKRRNKQEMEIQNKVLEHIQGSPSKNTDLSIISIYGTPIPTTFKAQYVSDTSLSSPVLKKRHNSIIEIESDSSIIGNIPSRLRQDLNLRSVSDINSFLHDEVKNRKIGKPRFSKHLNKKKWNELIKKIEEVLSKRKSLRKSKKDIVVSVKNILKSYIDS